MKPCDNRIKYTDKNVKNTLQTERNNSQNVLRDESMVYDGFN